VPDDTTLLRWAGLIQPETLERFNQRLTELATHLQVTKGRQLRTDGTVVETHIHPPADSRLLADGVRVLGRTLQRAKAALGEAATLSQDVFRNRTRSARRFARQVGEALRHPGEAAQAAGQRAYRRLVRATRQTLRQAGHVLPVLRAQTGRQAERLAHTLDTFLPRVAQVVDQTVRRVFQHEPVPAADKLVSLFEPHTAILRRNKAGKPTEYGRKVWLDEVDGGLVTRWDVLSGNPDDAQQWAASLAHHQERFGRAPQQASGDRGVHSPANERLAQQAGVQRVILPQPGYKSPARQQHERQPWFRRGRRWHAGVEGRISVLKRSFGLDCCPDQGETGFDKWVGWGVIAHNLRLIGRAVAVRV
jgi:IS5 family transposase